MEVYINGKLQDSVKSGEMLEAIIQDLRIEAQKEGEIVQVTVNGESVEENFPFRLAPNSAMVEIEIVNSIMLVIQGLAEGINYLPRLLEGLNEVVAQFRQGNQGQGSALFTQCIDGMNWVYHVLSGVKFYILPKQEESTLNISQDIAGFEQIVRELLEAWQNEDYVLISDLIEYELNPILERCQNHFVVLINLS